MAQSMKDTIFQQGEMFIGCNYWASHAGTNMWHDWRPDIIENDFRLLSEKNVNYLRIFPLWPDFQPIKMHRGGCGCDKEIRMGEDPLPFTEAGRAGVSELMCERFQVFCDLAEKYRIRLIVGLLTGWMSGRLYVPELFEKVNVLANPRAIKWEIRFVKYMVRRFKSHPAIAAWDLGNECNCMGSVDGADGGYLWVSAITDAIKTEDREHPVVSGMHSTFPESSFRPQELGEILDVLCTHPYPLFTPHCMTDSILENKSVLHAVAETVLYRGLSGKPAFAEEVGTLGPMIASEKNAAAYVNTIMHLLWAHDCMGFMWWCGFEQSHLTHTPYDWGGVERELGLFHADYSPKPVVETMSDFVEFTKKFGQKLPKRIVDAVCILTASRDSWLAAFGAFILAKQSGLDLEFCFYTDEIPEARAYLVPSLSGENNRHITYELLERVKNGAALYVSIGNAMLSPFNEVFGLEPQCHYQPLKPDRVKLGETEFSLTPSYKIPYRAIGATPLAYDEANTPVFTENKLGAGSVYFLTYPIEDMAGGNPGIDSGERMIPLYQFYQAMPQLRNPAHCVVKDNPHVAITEHIVDETTRLVVAVNCVPRETSVTLRADGWSLEKTIKNQAAEISAADGVVSLAMKPNSAVVLQIKRG